jgi:hypothetical protein
MAVRRESKALCFELSRLDRKVYLNCKKIYTVYGWYQSTKSYKECFKDLKLMTVPAIYIYGRILSIKHDNVKKNANFHEYNTRNRNGRHVEVHGTALYESKPSFKGAKFMKKFPQYIRDIVF